MDKIIFTEKYRITPKEAKLLEFLIKGLCENEIASVTNQNEESLHQEISLLFAKLNVENAIKASIKAIKEGFI